MMKFWAIYQNNYELNSSIYWFTDKDIYDLLLKKYDELILFLKKLLMEKVQKLFEEIN